MASLRKVRRDFNVKVKMLRKESSMVYVNLPMLSFFCLWYHVGSRDRKGENRQTLHPYRLL
jgi:hypothetical protein